MDAAIRRLALTLGLALALAFLGVSEGWAGQIVVLSNSPGLNDASFSAVASLGGTYSKAVGFTMPGTSLVLDTITLRLKAQAGSTNTLSVALYGDGGSGPADPALAFFDAPAIPTVASNVTFTPTSRLVLQSQTTYWLDVTGTSNTLNGIVWYASTSGPAPTGLASSAGARFSSTSGSLADLTTSSVVNTFEVTANPAAAAVPEPSGLIQAVVFIAISLTVVGWRNRRSPAA